VAIAVAIALSGCSGSSSSTSPSTTADVAAATTEAPEPSTTALPTTTTEPLPQYATLGSDYLFDQAELHTFEIEVPESSLAILDEDPAAEEYVEGSLTFEGETLAKVGVRYKGSVGAFILCTEGGFGSIGAGGSGLNPSGKKTCTKLSMKIKINWEDSDTRFYGVKKLQLHSQNLDPTYLHERFSYWTFREMGVPVPRSTHARVMINGEYAGLFALTEQIDEEFAAANFADGSGNIYKEVWPFNGQSLPRTEDEFVKALQNNTKDPNVEVMAALAADLGAAAPGEELDAIAKHIDIEQLLRTFVVDRGVENEDGPLHWYCLGSGDCSPHNLYWYEDPTTKKLSLIPWDLDNSLDVLSGGFVGVAIGIPDKFGDTQNNCDPFNSGAIGIPQRSAGCDPLVKALATLTDDYARIRAELVAGPLSPASINAQIDEWSAQIEPAVAEAHEAHDDAPTVEAWRTEVEKLRAGLLASLEGDGR
jgi:CotH kinase protein